MQTKVCVACEVSKSTTEFHKKKSAKDGLQARCKTCSTSRERLRHKEKLRFNTADQTNEILLTPEQQHTRYNDVVLRMMRNGMLSKETGKEWLTRLNS